MEWKRQKQRRNGKTIKHDRKENRRKKNDERNGATNEWNACLFDWRGFVSSGRNQLFADIDILWVICTYNTFTGCAGILCIPVLHLALSLSLPPANLHKLNGNATQSG